MPLRMLVFFGFIALIVLAIDLYGYKGIKMLTSELSPVWRKGWRISWWLPTVVWFGLFSVLYFNFEHYMEGNHYKFFYFVTGFGITFFVTKTIFILFHLTEDIIHVVRLAISKFFPSGGSDAYEVGKITRLQFLSQAGLALSGIVLGSMVYGQVKGKYNFKVFRQPVRFPDLPSALEGMTVVQLSDMHLGSFFDTSYDEIKAAVGKINELNPDFIFFTGDLVNNFAKETEPWIEILSTLKAKHGKYSILGNHDYGDYVPWDSQDEKEQNLLDLYKAHEKIGFRLLRNQNETLRFNGGEFSLIGVENWGQGFHQYGDLDAALQGVPEDAFKILLSHDPTHWEKKVMNDKPIHLTLSGHTHGMQLGVEIPSLGIKISPARLRYKRWAGLYDSNGKYLYVNRGFGFLGFPGRVGINPEITLLEFNKA